MMVFIVRKISSRTRSLLSAFNYEVSTNVFVSKYHAGLYVRIIKRLYEETQKTEQILALRPDTSFEGFKEEYVHWNSQKIDVDGLKFFIS